MLVKYLPSPTKNELVIGVFEASMDEPVTAITPLVSADADRLADNHNRLPSISRMVNFEPLTVLNKR
jgi:hypothetical protein